MARLRFYILTSLMIFDTGTALALIYAADFSPRSLLC